MTVSVINKTYPGRRTVSDLLARAVFELESNGIENSRHEAEQILAHCLKIESWRLYIEGVRPVTSHQKAEFHRLIAKRLDHHPLAYIRGWVGFHNLVLKADRRGLIPRPETEILVDRTLAELNRSPVLQPDVVDLGCGSGSIALALAGEHSGANILASDISTEALALARENAEDLKLTDRINFRHGDLFEPWKDYRENGFDFILSNPPYLSERELKLAPPEVIRNEPISALNGGPDGLSVIRRLVRESSNYLKSGGWLIFEIGADQGEAVREIVDTNKELEFFGITRDYSGRDRVVAAYRVIDSESH
jgi:release factor glutamine methyltransferase